MRKFVSIATLAAAVMVAPFVSAQTPAAGSSTSKPAAGSSSAKPAAKPAPAKSVASHSTNGTVKSVDASSLVITKAGAKPQDMTFALDASTQKQGTVEVGSMVTVHYKTEGSTNTATAITAKPAKDAAKTPKK
jgi:hypothetical protein